MPQAEDEKRIKPRDEQGEWVVSFVDYSKEKRDPFEDIWIETELNWLVRNFHEHSRANDTSDPLDVYRLTGTRSRAAESGFAVLKDPETHQIVWTIVSKLALALFPHDSPIRAMRVGFEDILKAKTVNGLLEYSHRLPGNFQTYVEWILGICIYGTSVIENVWEYREEPRPFRSRGTDEFGEDFDTEEILVVPVFDDPRKRVLDVRDFFPDPGATTIPDMQGAAKRIRITAAEARLRAESGLYKKAAVERAIEMQTNMDAQEEEDHPYQDETTGLEVKKSHDSFRQMVGYEYIGTVPFKTEDGFQRRIITVLAGETVRTSPWPRRLPWFEGRIIPRLGSFYGIAPAEIARFDQDFADVLKRMLADAVVRMSHPPHLVNRNAGVDTAKLRAFRPGVPVMADRMDAVTQVEYNPPVGPMFEMYGGAKQQMRESTGALGPIQGLGLGTTRRSATQASEEFNQAMDRPEMFATVLEREYLPPIAKCDLELYQEFLEDDEDVQVRVGDSEAVAALSDILADFDVKFVGTRIEGNKQQRIQGYREIFQASANPLVAQLLPWIPFLRRYFDDIGQPEIGAMVGNPALVELNMMLTQIGGVPGQNQQTGNGANQPAQGPSGLLPAQTQGSEVLG